MKIVDINGKEREIVDGSLKIIKHSVPAIGKYAKKGETKTQSFIQVTIKPHFDSRSPWKEFYPLNRFKKLNPKIKLKE